MHRGGERKAWFRVKCKSFGIIAEVVKGKVIGKVLERSQGFSSWIKFGEKSLITLLEGMEECCLKNLRNHFKKVESEGRRKYLQELRSNVARRFLLCSMAAGRFTLLFSKCKGCPGGWSTLAKKLRSLGVSSNNKVGEAFTKKGAFDALMGLNKDKPSSLDDFSLAFWQHY